MATTTATTNEAISAHVRVDPDTELVALANAVQALGLSVSFKTEGWIFKRTIATVTAHHPRYLSKMARTFMLELLTVEVGQG